MSWVGIRGLGCVGLAPRPDRHSFGVRCVEINIMLTELFNSPCVAALAALILMGIIFVLGNQKTK